jgi:hypothetical protein
MRCPKSLLCSGEQGYFKEKRPVNVRESMRGAPHRSENCLVALFTLTFYWKRCTVT